MIFFMVIYDYIAVIYNLLYNLLILMDIFIFLRQISIKFPDSLYFFRGLLSLSCYRYRPAGRENLIF